MTLTVHDRDLSWGCHLAVVGRADTVHRQHEGISTIDSNMHRDIHSFKSSISYLLIGDRNQKTLSALSNLDYLIPPSLLIGLVLFDTALLVIRTDKLNNTSFARII